MIEKFLVPDTLAEALRLQKEHGNCLFLAGGTEVLTRGIPDEAKCISLQKIDGLKSISASEKDLSIGAMVTLQELAEAGKLPGTLEEPLKSAARNVRNRNIRNIATVGGNIAANKSSSDLIPVLLVMQASIEYQEAGRTARIISLAEYIAMTGESRTGIISRIVVPIPAASEKFFLKRFSRTGNDLAIINIAVNVAVTPEKAIDCLVAIGGIDRYVVQPQAVRRAFQTLSSKSEFSKFSNDLRKLLETEIHPITDVRGSGDWKRDVVFGLLCEIAAEIQNGRGRK